MFIYVFFGGKFFFFFFFLLFFTRFSMLAYRMQRCETSWRIYVKSECSLAFLGIYEESMLGVV
jgi:hypothetical protein